MGLCFDKRAEENSSKNGQKSLSQGNKKTKDSSNIKSE